MRNEGKIAKKARRAIACAAVALTLALAGCAAGESDDLPETHLDGNEAVAVTHERCGGCHRGAQRGGETFEDAACPRNTDISYGQADVERLP